LATPPGLAAIEPLYALPRAEGTRALDSALAELDRFGVARAGVAVTEGDALAEAALARHPERFFATLECDPRAGMAELRRIERLARRWGAKAVGASPALLGVPVDDRRFYPLFAKCVELGLAFCPSLGVPEERVPFAPQKLERIDAVACAFPELRIVMRHGCEPWPALAVLLMRRHPKLFYLTSALLPRDYPPEIVAFANEDGADRVLFSSHPPAGEPRERVFKELREAGFARAVWRPFLRDNAFRVLRLP
jgi:hypothetical protein